MYERVKIALPTLWASDHLLFVLAEAILTEDAPGAEDGSSIVLQDMRTRHSRDIPGDEHERQHFLVGDDDEDDHSPSPAPLRPHHALEEDVQSFSPNASMDSQDNGPAHRPSSRLSSGEHSEEDKSEDGYGEEPRGPVLGNLATRTSHLGVHSLTTDEDATLCGDDEDDGGRVRHGLAAKVGIIIGIHNISALRL
ncbi:hypothetical protein BD413DRAFT_617056 [Trametes elegans]|nr:hypothetical protein BD413DRAFT_617056 [Trametes elegans]